MAGRRYDDVVYEERRDYSSRGSRRGYEDRYTDDEIEYRRQAAPPVREREREVLIRDDVRERAGNTPSFMREDYGRTTAGPMVLRAREREDFEFVPRRRRTPSPEPERKTEKEEIIIKRREESESRPPPRVRERDREYEREEIIIRKEDATRDARPPPPREVNNSREEIIVRREEKDGDRRPRFDDDDMVSIRRSDFDRRPARSEVDRDEIIIRREEERLDPVRAYDDYTLGRRVSHERARSRARRSSSGSGQEIVIRKDEIRGRSGEREKQEIIIRKTSRSRSPSLSSAPAPPPPVPEPQVIHAPTIHQEVITHHRHIDHGYEVSVQTRPRVVSRPPSPPSPPLSAPIPAPVRNRSEERIQISRTQTRNGRTENEDIVIDRNEGPAGPRSVAHHSPPPPVRDPYYDVPPARRDPRGFDREIQEEADYYNNKALERAYIGEAYHGATKDWALVDVPPGTSRVRIEGAGGGGQEITWQRYNGVRRSKFMPDGSDEAFGNELGRPIPPPIHDPRPLPAQNGEIGRRYGKEGNPTDGLWTEVTKDLVVKEAIQEMGYEFEETSDYYYIIAYLRYEDMVRLVGLSEDIRKERRKRAKEIEWENRALPPPRPESRPLAIEPPPPRPRQEWDREEERYIEREVVYRGGRPPPPPGWRR
ncbi:hypothetical protein B0A52_06854 [Exophiala mesophila]|uniref:DUF8035 domain-containing protein n=1 Tax=Exophiala mesophila TaxID=212818 RepID=A0A438N0A4_EXOME|nr:hypothetical protein B0A52_06854 [Exophiala mesophila]